MSEEKRLHEEEEYGLQLHHCSPLILNHNVAKIMKSIVDDAMAGLRKRIEDLLPGCDHEAASSIIKSKYYAAIDINMPQVLVAIKESLQIPCGQLLAEDAAQVRQYTDAELKDLRNKNIELKRKYLYNTQLKGALAAEAEVLDCLETAQENVAQLKELCKLYDDETKQVKNAMNLPKDS